MDQRFDKLEQMLGSLYKYVQTRFDATEERLERIENKIDNNHETRLSRLEDSMRVIKTKLGFN